MKYSSKFWQFLVATSHVSTLRDMNKWNKNCRFGGVGKMVNGMPFAHRMPVWSYASSTPKMCFFFDARAQAQVMICLRLQVLPCDYLGVPLLWLMRHPIHISIMILMNITFWLINIELRMSAVVSSQGAWWFHTRTQTDRHTHTHTP